MNGRMLGSWGNTGNLNAVPATQDAPKSFDFRAECAAAIRDALDAAAHLDADTPECRALTQALVTARALVAKWREEAEQLTKRCVELAKQRRYKAATQTSAWADMCAEKAAELEAALDARDAQKEQTDGNM